MEATRLMAINTGSSSFKAGVYRTGPGLPREARFAIDLSAQAEHHAVAFATFRADLRRKELDTGIAAIGHRIVHGGSGNTAPKLITRRVVEELRGLVPNAPEHMPQALAAIDALGQAFPGVPQVACFDTAFHRTMPRVAQLYGLPHDLQDQGLLRYGFHGLSCESIVHQLAELDEIAGQRVVIAHLGNGASMTAVLDGRSIETTMGFTPTGGLVMATRTGDLDPGALLYLLRNNGMDASSIADLVNKRAGLLGVSGTSGDMRRLLAAQDSDSRAADAVALFCHQARKSMGGLIAVLGGIDTLVFTGGIGEHADLIRELICIDLACFGIHLDLARNRAHAPLVSLADSPVKVRVLPTDEEAMIVRHTDGVLGTQGGSHVSI